MKTTFAFQERPRIANSVYIYKFTSFIYQEVNKNYMDYKSNGIL